MSRRALIAGASGLVGGHCLRLLLEDELYRAARSLVRRPSGAAHPKLEEVVVDFANLTPDDVGESDDVYCCLGTTIKKAGSREAFRRVDFGSCHDLARLAAENRARRFALVSSVAADPESPNFYLRVKGDLEAALGELPYETLAILRPSFLMGDRHEHRRGERLGILIAKLISPLLVGPLRQYKPIEAADVARAMVRSLTAEGAGARVLHYNEMTRLGNSGGPTPS